MCVFIFLRCLLLFLIPAYLPRKSCYEYCNSTAKFIALYFEYELFITGILQVDIGGNSRSSQFYYRLY